MVASRAEGNDSVDDHPVAHAIPIPIPMPRSAPRGSASDPARRLLDRAGLRPGHRILDLGRDRAGLDLPDDLPDASFDAVVALDWWPATTLAVAVRRWRRLLAADVGVVVLAGTDIPAVHVPGQQASRLWIEELASAGFTIGTAALTPTGPGHYSALADSARRVSGPLRAVLGAGLAESYLAHVELLDRATRDGSTHRFEIIARLSDE